MNILHITDIKNAKGNGVAVAVQDYIKYESKIENIALFNLSDNVECDIETKYNYDKFKKISELPKPFNKPDLVVFNEVYKPKYIKLYKECIKNKIKYIIIPHGCLVTEAQNRKKEKKILGNILLFNSFISNATAVQFLNDNERINSHFKYKKYIIAGNGVSCPKFKNDSKCVNKDFVFIGRYEIKHKGLDLLVKVCHENKEWFLNNNIKIQLYGRDSGNELIQLKQMIVDNAVSDVLIVNGPVYGDDKIKVLQNAYVFIQCSRFEGQPMGIIEALSIGLPCVVTYGTYLGEYIKDNKCGMACNFDSKEVFDSIKKLVENSDLRNTMSDNAYIDSNKDFAWENVIKKTINEYKKI